MLEYLQGVKGHLIINGVEYSDITSVMRDLKDFIGLVTVDIPLPVRGAGIAPQRAETNVFSTEILYKVKVRQYMTKPASPEFDFHTKWNAGIPMPLRVMVGRKLKETPGMVKMELWGDITEELTSHCMKCGKLLTNPVSQYFGIGPECGAHGYNNPFEDDAALKAAVAQVRAQLQLTRWTGWIIKSAIEEEYIIQG